MKLKSSEIFLIVLYKTLTPFLKLSRNVKKIIAILVDISLCILTVWFSFYLRVEEFLPLTGNRFWSVCISVVFAIPIFFAFGLYRNIFRYTGWTTMFTVLQATLVYSLLFSSVISAVGISGIPRTIGLIQPILLFILVAISRTLVSIFLGDAFQTKRKILSSSKALIYGAGAAGRQLVSALENSNQFEVIGFVDDDKSLHSQILNGKGIFSPKDLEYLIKSKGISNVLLAIPSLSRRRRMDLIKTISSYDINVCALPSIDELAKGRVTTSDLRNLDVNDLLGRPVVAPNQSLLVKNNTQKVVLVTGAGGSIGSELCRQIIKLNPKKIILVDINEYSLYSIHAELENISISLSYSKNPQIVPILASVQDENRMQKIMDTWCPYIIYHAAAYKHVPLVEQNIIEGLKNNILGTLVTAQVAIEKNVSKFVLISTDKAVRPTNVMGASKRLAEICLQALHKQQRTCKNTSGINAKNIKQTKITNFSLVRFGNVINSSGSVIPKFIKQIREGGPITLTDREITRYFMTIPEAAQLVIQAGALGKGGDMFILDMGEPLKIFDLITKMVELFGLSIRNNENPDGDIEISITGLRPGEKLFEELVLGDDPQPTLHSKIYKANDPFIPWEKLETDIRKLKTILINNNEHLALIILKKLVTGYKQNENIT